MNRSISEKLESILKTDYAKIFLGLLFAAVFLLFFFPGLFGGVVKYNKSDQLIAQIMNEDKQKSVILPPLDKDLYDQKMKELANNPLPKVVIPQKDISGNDIPPPFPKPPLWPVKAPYPLPGAILPFNRIIAYYGNLYSRKMGALGEYPEAEMFSRLDKEVKKWEAADPATPVIPALHYIAVTAQGAPGTDGKYRMRMPGSEIDKVLKMADKIGAIVFLDIQVGLSSLEAELPVFERYFKLPNVHLGLDPEFSMKNGERPGKVIGTFDAKDINFAANYLAKIVKENNLPPKVLVIHRFTRKMVTNYKAIKPLPEVQIVMHMDGWGEQAKKVGTYRQFIYPEPVQFAGFKLFYKNDLFTPGTTLTTPESLMKLNPRPIYIQYQ